MKLASLDDVAMLKVDHKLGQLVNVNTGAKVTLTPFRIVYARFGRKLFTQSGATGSWSLTCSSPDGIVGNKGPEAEIACGSQIMCSACKPVLMLGLRTEKGSLAVLDTTASIAREFSYILPKGPVPIFSKAWALRLMLTQKGSDMTYTQVQISPARSAQVEPLDTEACMAARARLGTVIDARLDRAPGSGKPSLAGASLKMK